MTQASDLCVRPIAHRGYHDASSGCIENTPSAISAALAGNFSIEVDVQETADGEALVFHDFTLDRLVQGTGPVLKQNAKELVKLRMQTGTDMLWMLQDLFDLVDGRVPLIIEIKSRYARGAQAPFVKRVIDQVAAYQGPACIKTFDPDMLDVAKNHNPNVLRGVVADAATDLKHYGQFSRMDRFIMRHMLHAPRTRPHFISYNILDLPCMGPSVWRSLLRIPIMAWTIRTSEQKIHAARHADQIIFEGFNPEAS